MSSAENAPPEPAAQGPAAPGAEPASGERKPRNRLTPSKNEHGRFTLFLRYCFMALGGLALAIGLAEIGKQTLGLLPEWRLHYFLRDRYAVSNFFASAPPTVPGYTAWLIGAGGLYLFGRLYVGQRFTLRNLLIGIMIIGVLGALPGLLLSGRGNDAELEVDLGRELEPDQMQALADGLDPNRLMAALPDGMWQELGLPPSREGLFSAEFESVRGVGLRCRLHFRKGLTYRQRATLIECFGDRLSRTVGERYSGYTLLPYRPLKLGGVWETWQTEYLNAHPAGP